MRDEGDLSADAAQGAARDVLAVDSNAAGLHFVEAGQQAEQRETMGGLIRGFAIALLLIFALLAVPLRSYSQPLVIMAAIPFGAVGAVWGHALMGLELTILSMFGLVALTGVVSHVLLSGVLWPTVEKVRPAH